MSDYSDFKLMATHAIGWTDMSLPPDVVLDLINDAERYRKLRTVTPYRFKRMQDASVTDGGDVLYFHSDRFDAAIDAISSPENP